MKTILITGIDGSGKSTFLTKLSDNLDSERTVVAHLPHTKELYFSENLKLTSACKFVFELSKQADIQNNTSLKTLALFSSMLLFDRVISAQTSDKTTCVFFERHPLIDIGVYATFYASKLLPKESDLEKVQYINTQYKAELRCIFEPISKYLGNESGRIEHFLNFLHERFHTQGRTDSESIAELFATPLPDEIYFLRARPEILFNRIASRNFREPHESVQVFEKLDLAYMQLLNDLSKKNICKIQIINTEDLKEIESLLQKFISDAQK